MAKFSSIVKMGFIGPLRCMLALKVRMLHRILFIGKKANDVHAFPVDALLVIDPHFNGRTIFSLFIH